MAYADEIAADAPLLWWRLGETSGTNANDETANNRDGTYTGGFTLDQPGLIREDVNRSVALDGVNGHVLSAYDPFTVDSIRSFEIWFTRTTSSTQDAMMGSVHATQSPIWRTAANANSVQFYPNAANGSALIAVTVTGLIAAGATVHLVNTYNDATKEVSLYLNGVYRGGGFIPGGTGYGAGGNVKIGARSSTNSDPFVGTIDEFAVYDGALSPARIAAHYAAGALSLKRMALMGAG